jgi:hypothetical protein
MHVKEEDPFKVGIAFRLPKDGDPEAFEERLRAIGLVGGELRLLPRAADESWERCIEILRQNV